MKSHNINISNKYIEPIRNGKITLLIFNKKKIHDEKPGDCIIFNEGAYEVSAKIKKTYLKSFYEITEEEVKKTGFLNKDFLKDELIQAFHLEPFFETIIRDEIFFIMEIEPKDQYQNYTNNVNLYSKEFDISKMNAYKNWRDFYYEKI